MRSLHEIQHELWSEQLEYLLRNQAGEPGDELSLRGSRGLVRGAAPAPGQQARPLSSLLPVKIRLVALAAADLHRLPGVQRRHDPADQDGLGLAGRSLDSMALPALLLHSGDQCGRELEGQVA